MARRIVDTKYKAVDGTSWSIEIWDLYSSLSDRDLKVEMMDPGFNLNWNGDENSVLQPLLGSACSLSLSLTEYQRGILMPLVYSQEEFRLALLLRKQNQVYWVGQIHTEECVELVTDGYTTIDIKASDGLAQLENIDFKDANGDPYEDRHRVRDWVYRILLKVPSVNLWYSQYQVGSVFAYEHHLNTPVLSGDNYQFNYTGDDGNVRGVLDYIWVDPSCWYLPPPEKSLIGDEFKRYPTTKRDGFVSCKTVLMDIMAALGATICFSDGAWRIFDRTYLFSESSSLTSSNVIQYTATQNGSLSAGIFQEQIDVDLDASSSNFFRGAVRKGLHPFAAASQTHKNAGSDLIYASGLNYSVPPNRPILEFKSAAAIEWPVGSNANIRPLLSFTPQEDDLFPYTNTPTINDLDYMSSSSGIFNFAGLAPIGSPSMGDLQLPNGQAGGQIRINIAARAIYKTVGYSGDTINDYVNRPGSMAILSFRFSVTDNTGVKHYLRRRVRTVNRYTSGQEVEVPINGSYTNPGVNDPDFGQAWHYKPKYYESDYYEWVLDGQGFTTDQAYVDIMMGGDPSVLESGTSEPFGTVEWPGTALYTPPLTKIDSNAPNDGELKTDNDDSRRDFEIRFDHAIFLPDNSATIESCEMESMWIAEHDANGGPGAARSSSGAYYPLPSVLVKAPSYRTETTALDNDGVFNTTYFNHPRSLQYFSLKELEIYAGDGSSNYDNVNTFVPTTVYGNESYVSPSVVSGGGNINLSGNQYPVGRYAVKSYSQSANTNTSLFFKMSTQWDSSDLADRMTHRVNKNVMQIRHRVREVIEGSLFSSTANGVILEPWQRLVTKKLKGNAIETFVPFRVSLEFKQAEQNLTLIKCRSELATLPGEAVDEDVRKGNKPFGGTSNPIGPVHFVSSKVFQNEDDIVSIYSKTNNITITQPVNLDSIETNLNSLYSNFKQGTSTDVYAGADLTTHLELTGTTANLKVNTTGLEITETSPGDIEFVVATDASGATPFTAVHLDGLTTGSSADFLIKQGTNLKVYGSTGYAWLRHTGGNVQVGLPGSSGTLALQSEVYTDADADARIALASIDDLVDVDATGVSDGDALAYNATSGNWEPTNSTGGNHAFHQIAVSGQSTVEADNANDVLTLVAGSNLAITTDANTDTVTFTPSLTPTFTSVTAGILSTSVGIVNSGTLSAGNTTINGTLTSGAISSNSTISCSALSFAGSGTSTIAPVGSGAAFPDDLELRSNGNITLVLDYDSDEAAQAFVVKNQAGTVIFQVDEDGISSGLFTTTTPTITTISNFESTQTGTVTVSNYDSSLTYVVKLYNSSGTEQTTQTITNNSNGTWSITNAPVLTSAYVTVKALEIGKLVSATATSNSFNITAAATQQRYWRLQMTDASKNPVNAMVALGDFRLYTATGGGGTAYPSNMTSETAPTPYVVTKGYEYGTYLSWKAMDGGGSSASSMWWTISNSVAANNWIQIDLGSSIDFGSGECQITTSGGWTSANYAVLYGSNTGAFSGEEREMAFFQNIDKAAESGGTFTTYTQAIT